MKARGVMENGDRFSKTGLLAIAGSKEKSENGHSPGLLHPAWQAFMRYCEKLQHGDVERLRIQDGLPVLAEVTTKKVKFT